MRNEETFKSKVLSVISWLGIAVASTLIAMVFIAGFKTVFGF
ncbi:hypothetical protein [Urechidicola sp. KH5]